MAETYSAGIVTAYGAAVRGGYTGTYEDWCRDMAQLGDNVQQVAEDREAVEETAQTFTAKTVPGAVQTVQQAGATQVQAVETAGNVQIKVARAQAAAAATSAEDAEESATGAAGSATAAAQSASAAAASETAAKASEVAAKASQDAAETAAATIDTRIAGKIDKPSNPSSGAFLVWNGSAWVAQTLATWQGGSY